MNGESNIIANGLAKRWLLHLFLNLGMWSVETINDPEMGFSNSFSEQEHKELLAIVVATLNVTEI